jgi:hypothetical protein
MAVPRTPVAQVSGPITNGKGWPFASPVFDVDDYGYVMEEFILDGVACSYRLVDGATVRRDGLWETDIGDLAPYRTRMYVVRPRDPARFNGVVIVNWQNVTAGVDLGAPSKSELEQGFAWVGITTQRVAMVGQRPRGDFMPGTTGLTAWDPERYGSLHHPGDEYSYDIFSQCARTVGADRTPAAVDPLAGLEPRMLIAHGGSQSSIRLGAYLNIAHQRDRVFDGFFLTVHWGMCSYPPNQSVVASFKPLPDGWFAGSSQIRDDGGTPVLVLASESETLNNLPVRQPDSDTFRFWEMAGTAHAEPNAAAEMQAVFARDGLAPMFSGDRRNDIAWDYVRDASLVRLVEWVDSGRAPRSFPPIEVDDVTATIRTDRFGNALGGIRLAEMEAPLGRNRGTNASNPLAALSGESVPFDEAELAELYGDVDAYLKTWDGAVDRLLAEELVLPGDVDSLRQRGRRLAERLPRK